MRALIDKVADRVRWGYLLAFILLLGSYILSSYSTKRLKAEAELVNHTHNVINNVELLFSTVKDAESGFRAYLLTSDPLFLDRYNIAPKQVDSIYNELKILVSDNEEQKRNLDTMYVTIQQRMALFSTNIALYRAAGNKLPDTVLKGRAVGKFLMDKVRWQVAQMQANEKKLMEHRRSQVGRYSGLITLINIASLVLAVLIIFYSFMTFNKENAAKREADAKAKDYQQQLEGRIDELNKLNKQIIELKGIEKFALTGRISRTIAHEVRNPLTNINLAVEQLKGDLEGQEDHIMMLDMISRNSTRINQLISDLLNSTRTNLLVYDNRDVNELLEESLEFAADRIELKNIKVIKQYTHEKCIVSVDVQKIRIALLNIIVNAVEAMEEDKGELTLKTVKEDGRCVVYISDNGKGIDEENLSRLFEPYYTTKENGTGLGLTNTQNIILSHKASILVESEVGKGTMFMISFNLVEENA
jgi:signal transduction histidine kinase